MCLVEQLSKGYASKDCPIAGKGHSVSVSPQASSVLRKQLQEEAQGLRHLYQEKVLPQQNLVVSLEARGPVDWGWGGRSGGQEEAGLEHSLPLTNPISPPRPSSTSVSGRWHPQHQTSRWLLGMGG